MSVHQRPREWHLARSFLCFASIPKRSNESFARPCGWWLALLSEYSSQLTTGYNALVCEMKQPPR